MVSKVKKIVGGVVIVFVVLALIGACLGEDEGDSEYLAWLEKKCPNCIFEKVEYFEGRALDRDDENRLAACRTGELVAMEECQERVVKSLASQKSEFDDIIKVTQIVRTYKVKDEYKPESEWRYRRITEFVFSVLSMPKGIERMRIEENIQTLAITNNGRMREALSPSLYNTLQNYKYCSSFDLSNKETVRLVTDTDRYQQLNIEWIAYALLSFKLSWREPVYIYFAKK